MNWYEVPINLSALVAIQAKSEEELLENLHEKVVKALSEGGRLTYEEWQLDIFEDQIEDV